MARYVVFFIFVPKMGPGKIWPINNISILIKIINTNSYFSIYDGCFEETFRDIKIFKRILRI